MNKMFILRGPTQAQALWAFLKANWEASAAAGKPLQIVITYEQTKRSLEQNKRYWAILKVIEETGWIHGKQFTREAWHHFFRIKFLPCLDGPDGLIVPSSTTKLTVEEMTDYMTQVENWAGETLGIDFVEAA